MAVLVLKKWQLSQLATTSDVIHVEIVGRRSGIISWLLTLCGINPTASLLTSDEGVTLKSTSLAGENLRFIPFDSLSSVAWEIYKPWKMALLIFFVAAFVLSAIVGAIVAVVTQSGPSSLIPPIVGLPIGTALAAVLAFLYYKFNTQFALEFTEIAGSHHGIRFKRSLIEGVNVNQGQAEQAYRIIRRLMMTSRAAHTRSESPPLPNSFDSTPAQASSATPSVDEQEALAVQLFRDARTQLANGNKHAAIELLRELVRLYPNTRIAEKARVSLKDR